MKRLIKDSRVFILLVAFSSQYLVLGASGNVGTCAASIEKVLPVRPRDASGKPVTPANPSNN